MNRKKWFILLLAAVVASSAAACAGGGTEGQASSGSTGSGAPASAASAPASSVSASSSSLAASEIPAGPVKADSMPEETYKTVSAAPDSKAVSAKNSDVYRVKDSDYSYKKNNLSYKVSYPQLSGKSGNYDGVNAALKNCAMKTVSSLGTAARKEKASVRCGGDVTYEGRDFISVGFNEFVTVSPKDANKHVLRTVNYDLKNKKELAVSDLLVKNDAFYKALSKAAGSQLNDKLASAATADALKKGLNQDAVFFTDSGVGFSVQLPGDAPLLKIFLSFDEAKPFMTKNAAWSSFV